MHQLRGTGDGVHGTGLDAQGAADTARLVDAHQGSRPVDAEGGVQRLGSASQEAGEAADGGFATRRALVDVRFAGGYGAGVIQAAGIAALGALGLRQPGVDLLDEPRVVFRVVHRRRIMSLHFHARLRAFVGRQ